MRLMKQQHKLAMHGRHRPAQLREDEPDRRPCFGEFPAQLLLDVGAGRVHDPDLIGLEGVELAEKPAVVPVEGGEDGGVAGWGLKDFFDFDVVGAGVLVGPGSFDDAAGVLDRRCCLGFLRR